MPNLISKAQTVIDIEIETLLAMRSALNSDFEKAVLLIKEKIESEKKIVVIGVGKSGNIGHKISATFNSTGATSVVLNAQNALHGDLGIVSRGDVILALSCSGETSELLSLLPHLKKKGVSIISITAKTVSTLAEVSDFVLHSPVDKEACPLGLAPTSSSTAALVMGDALAMTLLESRGFTEENFASYHPGGALGKALLTRVDDIMRTGDQMALCDKTCTVMDAIKSMGKARAGSCIITNEKKELIGIFSHGDFARAFQENPQIGEHLVIKYMTTNPIKLMSHLLAAEAIHLLKNNKVDDIPVIDESNKVVGIVDTQDFARLKLV